MDSDYLQSIRYKLQRRYRRLISSNYSGFYFALKQSWHFLESSDLFSGVMSGLALRSEVAKQAAENTISGSPEIGETEEENSAICYWVLKMCAESSNRMTAVTIGRAMGGGTLHDEALAHFKDAYLEPFFDHLDDSIDDQRSVLALLKKFKHRAEWFRREELSRKYLENTSRGEDLLSRSLYEYLHDQGVEFSIEERSGSGRPDLVSSQTGIDRLILVSSQTGIDRLILDAKIFDPEKGKNLSYLRRGFHQIYQYTRDFNEVFGYLVIFKVCGEDLSVSASKQENSFPFVCYNSKTIFLIVVDVHDYEKTASKRGTLKSYDLEESSLVETLESEN